MLVELAQEREETIPALVYEARPVRRDNSQHARAAADAEEGPVGLAAGEDGAAAPPTLQQMAAAPQRQGEARVEPRWAWHAACGLLMMRRACAALIINGPRFPAPAPIPQ